MKNKFREYISGLLYVVALFSFLGAITATSHGSMLDFSNLARLIFCGLAVICIIAATLIWKATDSRERNTKIIAMIVAIAIIVIGGFIDSKFGNSATLEYVSIDLPFEFSEVEKIEMYHYDGVPVSAEMKTVIDSKDMKKLYDLFNSISLQIRDTEEVSGASVTSFRFNLTDDSDYELIYVGNGVKNGILKSPTEGFVYFTSADIGWNWRWLNEELKAVPVEEKELPGVTITAPITPFVTE